ncbi:beta-lactamase family protein [Candidatus Bathyarchaeota archaeon]|jgi:D-alanyl-D-alanine carboxypeptidase|nr:beta-lactamase family protein [Candidatus Bathyarchaeota archaeon]
MKKTLIALIAVIIIALLLTGALYSSFVNQPDYTTQIESMMDKKWAEYASDNPAYNGTLSMRIISPKGDFFVSTSQDSMSNVHFRGASTTKTFTAAAIMLLHQEGQLNIDDKITQTIPGKDIPYVPNSVDYAIPYKENITIRQLLGHTAGVFDVSNTPIPENVSAPYAGVIYTDYIKESAPEHNFSFDELIRAVAANQLSYFAPSEGYHYSNTGYSILGKIIECVSGMSYSSFVEQRLLQPNGLENTSFPSLGNERQLPAPYAEGYTYIEGELYETTQDNMSPHVAEGNVITTVDDLCKWGKLLYSGQAGIKYDLVTQMIDVKPTGEEHKVYGLGTEYAEGLGFGHNGAHAGYMTVMRYDRETDIALVIYASALNADDLYGQMSVMYKVAQESKQILGYST